MSRFSTISLAAVFSFLVLGIVLAGNMTVFAQENPAGLVRIDDEEKPAEEPAKDKDAKEEKKKEDSDKNENKEEGKKESEKEEGAKDKPKRDEPKKDDVKKDEPKEEPNKDEPKVEPKEEPKKEDPKPEAKKPAPESIELKNESMRLTVKVPGTFDVAEPKKIRLKSNEFAAFEVELAKNHGEFVRQGETLVKFKNDKYEEALAEKKRTLRLSEMSLREEELSYSFLEKTFPFVKEEFELSKKENDESIADYYATDRGFVLRSFDLSRKNIEYSLESAQEELRQLEKMYEADDLVEETEEFILKRNRLQVESAKLNFERNMLALQHRIDRDFPRMEDALKRSQTRDELNFERRREFLEYPLEQAKIRLERKRIAFEKEVESLKKFEEDRQWLTITAPDEGVVYYGEFENGKANGGQMIAGMLKVGETAKNNTVLMTIVPERPNLIRVAIPEKELHWIKKGVTAKAVPVAFPDLKINGKVDSINAYPGINNDYVAVLSAIVPKSTGVVPGMNANLEFIVYDKKETIVVHKDAVQIDKDSDDSSKGYVFVLDKDNNTEKVRIKLGKADGDKLEILEGVKPGMKILKKSE